MTEHDDDRLVELIPAKDRLDAILEAPYMTTEQAVAAMQAQVDAARAASPHILVTTVMAEKALDDDELVPYRAYHGPFINRETAESWATEQWADNPDVTWECALLEAPERHDRTKQRLREIMERRRGPQEQ